MNINPIKMLTSEQLEKWYIFSFGGIIFTLFLIFCGLFLIVLEDPDIGLWVTIVAMGLCVCFGGTGNSIETQYYILNINKQVKKK